MIFSSAKAKTQICLRFYLNGQGPGCQGRTEPGLAGDNIDQKTVAIPQTPGLSPKIPEPAHTTLRSPSVRDSDQGQFRLLINSIEVKRDYDFDVKYKVIIDDQMERETNIAPRSQTHELLMPLQAGLHSLAIEYWQLRSGTWGKSPNSGFQKRYHETDIDLEIKSGRITVLRINISNNGLMIQQDMDFE